MAELDQDQSNLDLKLAERHGTFEKLDKTSKVLNEQIRLAFLRSYGVDGIEFGKIE